MRTTKRFIDLSVSVNPDHWEPEPVKRRVIDHKEGADMLGKSYAYFQSSQEHCIDHRDFPDEMGLSLMIYELSTHTGTHVDAPFHYGWRTGMPTPATISEIPLDWCYGPGVLLDFSNEDENISIDDVSVQRKLHDAGHELAAGDIVLVNTGAYHNVGGKEYFTKYRGIERSAVAWLTEHGVRVIGTDAFSFDKPFCDMIAEYVRGGDKDCLWPAHFYGRDRPYLQIERLGNLEELPAPTGFTVCCFPIKLEKADAAWSRVVAIVDV